MRYWHWQTHNASSRHDLEKSMLECLIAVRAQQRLQCLQCVWLHMHLGCPVGVYRLWEGAHLHIWMGVYSRNI